MKVGITPSETELLFYISSHGPTTGYDIGKNFGYRQKTAYASAKKLVLRGMLTRETVGKTRAGKDKIDYHLTVIGLSAMFSERGTADLDIVRISDHWGHLLRLVLGKWDVLKTINEDYARQQLLLGSIEVLKYYEVASQFDINLPSGDIILFYESYLTEFFYGSSYQFQNEAHRKWLQEISKRDSKIHAYLIAQVKWNISHQKKLLKDLKI